MDENWVFKIKNIEKVIEVMVKFDIDVMCMICWDGF